MTYQVIIPVLVAFAITAVLGPVIIPFLRKLKIGNTEREELESHQKKNGNPDHGWYYDPYCSGGHIIVLCEGLSTDHTGFICDGRIWNHWIPG